MNHSHPTELRDRIGPWQVVIATLLAVCGAIVITLLPAPAIAADAAAWKHAAETFAAARAGKDDAIERAAGQWRALSEADPTDPVARAYAGAATAMQAKTTMLPWRKLSYADDGLAMIDKALAQVAAASDSISPSGVAVGLETRFVAATTFLALPSMFNRGARGAKLLDELVRNPQFAAAPAGFRAAVWLRAGDLALAEQRAADARQWFERAAASGAPQAALAQARLKSL